MAARDHIGRWAIAVALSVLALTLVSAVIWRDDIVRTWLDPKQPFQTYRPPAAPDYGAPQAWALEPAKPALWTPFEPAADVFFVHPTTFDGGADWNGPINDRRANHFLTDVILPNYAGPFQRVGRVFAPRYRQASLYAFMTNKEDAQDSRRFAYTDVRRAFQTFVQRYNDGRPIIIVGVEQGAGLADHLLDDVVAPDPALRSRLVAAYLIDAIVLADRYGPGAKVPACVQPDQSGCVLAWEPTTGPQDSAQLAKRALIWSPSGSLENLGDRAPLCVNPLLGAKSEAPASVRLDLGAANASGLEWGVRPAFLPRQVSAQCVSGFLEVTTPPSPSLRRSGGWTDHLKETPFNLFYANEEADAKARLAGLTSAPGYRPPTAPLGASISVIHSPIHRLPD